jgi:GT2 family glycosyltransferase
VVYVDSASTDGSIALAKELGAQIVALGAERPLTAARARNAGFAALRRAGAPAFVQFVDGDCELAPAWPREAAAFLASHPDVAIACGRVRERFPEKSVYNRLCDIEWDAAAGETVACGGVAMARASAFEKAGGYNEGLVGGEEPELCVRLRETGWKIHRLAIDMALHDAAISSFAQWAARMKRGGRAFAEVSHLHRRSPARIWRRETLRALFWATLLPIALVGALLHPAFLALLLAYPLQIVRLAAADRGKLPSAARERPWTYAAFMTLAKFPEAAGVLEVWVRRLAGARPRQMRARTEDQRC